MIPQTTRIDTENTANGLELVDAKTEKPKPTESEPESSAIALLSPELRAIFEASWAYNEAAYRYLGR